MEYEDLAFEMGLKEAVDVPCLICYYQVMDNADNLPHEKLIIMVLKNNDIVVKCDFILKYCKAINLIKLSPSYFVPLVTRILKLMVHKKH